MTVKRKSARENLNLVLFDEVSGLCPKCNKPLIKRVSKGFVKVYEVAHIYPLNPLVEEIEILKNEVRLNSDVNHEDNLIALCRDCHKVFDNPRTVNEYRELVAIKRDIQRVSKIKNGWFEHSLDSDINEIIQALAQLEEKDLTPLSFAAKKVEEKADETLSLVTKLKIKNNVNYFYIEIKKMFAELDKTKPQTSDVIFGQVATYYKIMKRQKLGQDEIFAAITGWVKSNTNSNEDIAEVVVSFFVQNCEVFS